MNVLDEIEKKTHRTARTKIQPQQRRENSA